tara:strand:- start:143 stop:874 length:732 start_codon:yes stop_codon:yes gene_type:complete
MISKTKLKLIKSLKYKKTRDDLNLFLVEGLKGILEVNNSKYKIIFTVVSNEIFEKHKNDLPKSNLYVVDAEEINKYSLLKKNNIGFCVVELIPHKFSLEKLENITIALDSISDPGNLGTIIRNADWYGIKNIICSRNTVDFYNPKVIQSSMGSFTRVNVFYEDLDKVFNNNIYVIGTTSDQNKVNNFKGIKTGVILFGNESKGISKKLENYISDWISIKRIGSTESLNVSVSSGIILEKLLNS